MVSATKSVEVYRVLKSFQWNGWMLAPNRKCKCSCSTDVRLGCPGQTAQGCNCKNTTCHCDCGIPANQYGGDVWLVEPGNPRKESMLTHRFVTYDASLPSGDELLAQDKYRRLLEHWKPQAETTTGRSKGRG